MDITEGFADLDDLGFLLTGHDSSGRPAVFVIAKHFVPNGIPMDRLARWEGAERMKDQYRWDPGTH